MYAVKLEYQFCMFSAGTSYSPSFSCFAGYKGTVDSQVQMDTKLGSCHICIKVHLEENATQRKWVTALTGAEVV